MTRGHTVQTVQIPGSDDHNGHHLITVTLAWVCRVCGGPRGQVARGISYDGSRQLACDGWTNPCGHVDLYSAVRNEAKRSSNGARHDHRGHSAEWCAVAAADPAVPCRQLVPGGGTVEQATKVPTDQERQDRVDRLTAFEDQVGAASGVLGALLVGVAQVERDLRQCRRAMSGKRRGKREVQGCDRERFQRGNGRCGGGHQGDEQLLPPVPDLGIPNGVVLVGRLDTPVERVEPRLQAAPSPMPGRPARQQRRSQSSFGSPGTTMRRPKGMLRTARAIAVFVLPQPMFPAISMLVFDTIRGRLVRINSVDRARYI